MCDISGKVTELYPEWSASRDDSDKQRCRRRSSPGSSAQHRELLERRANEYKTVTRSRSTSHEAHPRSMPYKLMV